MNNLEKEARNCFNCQHKAVCKFTQKMGDFQKTMYEMFEYPEWNNIKKILFTAAHKCQFFKLREKDTP